jgi:hypothetical protein
MAFGLKAVTGWWYARLRKIDMDELWPCLVAAEPNLDKAKAAFACHALHDPAWLFLGRGAVIKFIDDLKGA